MNGATIHHFQSKSLYGFPNIFLLKLWNTFFTRWLLLFIIIFLAWLMKERSGCDDLPGDMIPPKLRWISVLLIGVLFFLVGVLLFHFLVWVFLFGLLIWLLVWLGLLVVQPHVDEDVGDIILHGRCQPPALLSKLGVVCYGVLHLLLLCAKGSDLAREV